MQTCIALWNPIRIVQAWITTISFMPHLCQVWFAKLMIDWYLVEWGFMDRAGRIRGDSTGPINGTPAEKVWEPLLYRFFCLGYKDFVRFAVFLLSCLC